MASVISVIQNSGQSYGGSAKEVAKNVSYLISADDAAAGKVANPLVIPNSGINYSYEVWIRCRCDLAPFTLVQNFKVWYVSGVPSGFTLTVNSDIVDTYQAPVNLLSSQGTRVDFTTKNSEGDSIALDGTLIDVGDYTSWLVFQLQVSSTAAPGLGAVDYIIQYDEY